MSELTLTIPPDRVTLAARLLYAEQVREKLRREHNVWGASYEAGKITEAEWEAYKREVHDPRDQAVGNAILAIRGQVKEAARAASDEDLKSIVTATVFTEARTLGD